MYVLALDAVLKGNLPLRHLVGPYCEILSCGRLASFPGLHPAFVARSHYVTHTDPEWGGLLVEGLFACKLAVYSTEASVVGRSEFLCTEHS